MKELTGAAVPEEEIENEAERGKVEKHLSPKIAQDEKKENEKQKTLFKVNSPKETLSSLENATIISPSMVIVGEVKSQDNIEVQGIIKGPIETMKNLIITGKVQGDVKAQNIVLENCAVQGNVVATEKITIGKNAILIGDISANNLVSAGKVKGNILVKDLADLSDTALVNGDITAERIIMDQGVKLSGKVTILSKSNVNESVFDIKFDI